METTNRDISLLFYHYLCDVVGSEDVVKTRRQIFNALDYVRVYPGITCISSGSKAEGLDLKGSDFDQMHVFNCYPVHETFTDLDQYTYEIPFIMDIAETKPGFTRLELYDKNDVIRKPIFETSVTLNGKIYISSKYFRERYIVPGTKIHGPCSSTDDDSVDYAHCFHCKEWITQAQPWLYRSRLSWPSNNLIDIIQRHGVLYVPIGSKDSRYEHIEWRISFSVAERQLIHSFSHTQLLCYALLKILLKDVIKEKHEGLLCSYFLKTILFWLSEEMPCTAWKPEHLLQCFMDCFRRLIYCVEYTTCLHYFIPESNLFEGKFEDSQRKELLYTLSGLYKTGWTCLLQTQTLHTFGAIFQGSPCITKPTASYLSSLYYVRFGMYNSLHFDKVMLRSMFGCKNRQQKQLYAHLLSFASQKRAQSISFPQSNKHYYSRFRTCQAHLLMGSNHDAVSGWLLLASFYYTQKRFNLCLQIVSYVLLQCTPDKVLLDDRKEEGSRQAFNLHRQLNQRCRLLTACKKGIIDHVTFSESSILPYLLKTCTENRIRTMIPPVVFAHFLNFLCTHHLGDRREKLFALRELEITVKERYFVLDYSDLTRIAESCLFISRQIMENNIEAV